MALLYQQVNEKEDWQSPSIGCDVVC
jgi:hypothetical protein